MNTESVDAVRRHLEELARNAALAADQVAGPAARYAELVRATLQGDGKLLFAGNGGSAASAEHMATEYVVRLRRQRRALPAIALSSCTATLSACANDFGFERVFARVLEAHGRAGDLLVLHSTSGNSENLLEAARAAREMQITSVALLNRAGGRLAPLVDLPIQLPADDSAGVQELQLAVEHAVADLVDEWFAANRNGP
ncbi:MAG: SIS domain-containing protein [marine benthic group bacterium]|jgi:D-sedoheptulose 7-phosphate isomerase|nr:SIS domain-containing protein [Candidatus Benthicola marisminoris]